MIFPPLFIRTLALLLLFFWPATLYPSRIRAPRLFEVGNATTSTINSVGSVSQSHSPAFMVPVLLASLETDTNSPLNFEAGTRSITNVQANMSPFLDLLTKATGFPSDVMNELEDMGKHSLVFVIEKVRDKSGFRGPKAQELESIRDSFDAEHAKLLAGRIGKTESGVFDFIDWAVFDLSLQQQQTLECMIREEARVQGAGEGAKQLLVHQCPIKLTEEDYDPFSKANFDPARYIRRHKIHYIGHTLLQRSAISTKGLPQASEYVRKDL
ncbi:hypothetical protein BJ508DRAFT_341056 [Ascobolus immersus RN42]|uniref:Uncharacterized protein n=1 Tax=Ascobolus immersus RN42 TaxID=1160509 RepID=A0A3N4IEL6_ASCIM|nr:hypothetical protein BJ508DRAFT_341056 [Ascobolus immersus RN42]